MKHVFTFLLMLLPVAIEAWLDIRDHNAGLRDKKKTDIWLLRLPVMLAACMINVWLLPNGWLVWIHGLQSFVLAFGVFFLLFDPLMGYLLVRDVRYLGETSETDVFWKRLPWWQVFLIRLWVMAVACSVYFHLDLIV